MGTAVRPAKTSPGPWDAFGMSTASWTKCGRNLLVVRATAVIRHVLSSGKASPWLLALLQRKSPKLAAVALANTNAAL
jgi:transposase